LRLASSIRSRIVDATEENFDKTFGSNVRGLLHGPEGASSVSRWRRVYLDFEGRQA
jgi:hypothetical protein